MYLHTKFGVFSVFMSCGVMFAVRFSMVYFAIITIETIGLYNKNLDKRGAGLGFRGAKVGLRDAEAAFRKFETPLLFCHS